jgi:8-oxo-dGTP pyrophosphatase MutT (NUDIX family)
MGCCMSDNIDLIDGIVSQYLKIFPDERASLAALIDQIANEDNLNNRKTLPGHITGSAFVISPDHTRILLVFHKYLKRWLQPGGHWEADETDPWSAAKREAEEETGVIIGHYERLEGWPEGVPLDIEVQTIPENPLKDETDHYHYDFRYVFFAEELELNTANAEYPDAAWFDFDTTEGQGIRRAIEKMRKHQII